MIWGLSGAPVNPTLPYAGFANRACVDMDFPPPFAYAIAFRETLCLVPTIDPVTVVSGDGGHGIMQLTSSWPENWADPLANFTYAIRYFLLPAVQYWHGLQGYAGPVLVKLVAATYNEGLGAAIRYHNQGDVDLGTTNDYGAGVLAIYNNLVSKGTPI